MLSQNSRTAAFARSERASAFSGYICPPLRDRTAVPSLQVPLPLGPEISRLALTVCNGWSGTAGAGCAAWRPRAGDLLDVETQHVYNCHMTKKLIRHGNSAALVLDKALLELLNVQMDTPLQVTTDGHNIIISPQSEGKGEAAVLEALERINQKHGSVLARLGK